MSLVTPVPRVIYTRHHPDQTYHAPGRPDLTGSSRELLVPGLFFPDASTVGVISAEDALIVSTGPEALFDDSYNGETISNRRFSRWMRVTGQDITFKNCLIEGPPAEVAVRALVECRNATVQNLLFEDCTFRPAVLHKGINNIMGRGYTLRRCDMKWAVDCASVAPAGGGARVDVVMEGTWFHEPTYWSPEPGQPDNQTHNDLIQWHGAVGLTIRGCRFDGFYNPTAGNALDPSVDSGSTHISGNLHYPDQQCTSALMCNKVGSFPVPGELAFEDSWVNGGAYGLNLAGVGSNPAWFVDDGSHITGNRFGYDFRAGDDWAVAAKGGAVFELSGNHRWNPADPWDASISFNVRKNG